MDLLKEYAKNQVRRVNSPIVPPNPAPDMVYRNDVRSSSRRNPSSTRLDEKYQFMRDHPKVLIQIVLAVHVVFCGELDDRKVPWS